VRLLGQLRYCKACRYYSHCLWRDWPCEMSCTLGLWDVDEAEVEVKERERHERDGESDVDVLGALLR